jgi:hypothetical protein
MFAAGRVRPKEKPGEGAIYRASLAMGVTVACPDHGGWSSFAGSRSQIRQARDARRDRSDAPSSERTLTRRG